jgi:hypothetical protein
MIANKNTRATRATVVISKRDAFGESNMDSEVY